MGYSTHTYRPSSTPPPKKNNRRVIQHRQQCGMLAEGYKECVCCVYIYIHMCVCVCLGVLPKCNRVMQGRQITQETPLEFVKNKRAVFKKGSFGERALVPVFGVSHSIFCTLIPVFKVRRSTFLYPRSGAVYCRSVLCALVAVFPGSGSNRQNKREEKTGKPEALPPPHLQKIKKQTSWADTD